MGNCGLQAFVYPHPLQADEAWEPVMKFVAGPAAGSGGSTRPPGKP